MALIPRITTEAHGSLPDVLKSEYIQRGDLFVLDVTPTEGWALEDVGGLKTALQKERQNVTDATSKFTAYGDLDPAAAREALAKVAEMSDWTPEKKVLEKIDAEKKQLESRHKIEFDKLTGSNGKLQQQLEGHLVNSAATAAISKHEGVVELLLPIVRNSVKVETDAQGNFVARVLGEDGNPRISMRQGNTGYMDIDEYVESMKVVDSYAPAFKGNGKSGTGSTGSSGNNAGGGKNGPSGAYVDESSGTVTPSSLEAAAEHGINFG